MINTRYAPCAEKNPAALMNKTILSGIFILLVFAGKSQIENRSKELCQKIDSVLSVNIDQNGPSLSLIVTEHGKDILFEGYYGMADVSMQKPLTKSHKLGIASMSKQFTGMAILCLVEDGKLKLEDDINTYLPELLQDRRKITITQLLSHTSGLPEYSRRLYGWYPFVRNPQQWSDPCKTHD